MSESRIPCDWENCCTCAYWSGDRSTEGYGSIVVVDTTEFAPCMNRDHFYMSSRNAYGSCSHFEKWAPLRD